MSKSNKYCFILYHFGAIKSSKRTAHLPPERTYIRLYACIFAYFKRKRARLPSALCDYFYAVRSNIRSRANFVERRNESVDLFARYRERRNETDGIVPRHVYEIAALAKSSFE